MLREEIKNISSTKKDLKQFGFLVGGILAGIGALMEWRGNENGIWFAGVGLVLVFFGAIRPDILKPFQRAWMTLAVILGAIVSRAILLLVFYLLVTPIGIILKLSGKRFMNLGFDREAQTYWKKRASPEFTKEDIERQF